MKIGLVCPYNVASGGGVQVIVNAMQEQLAKRGHTAKIITHQPSQISNLDTSNMIFLGRAIDVHWPTHTTAPISSGFGTDAIEQIIESEKFDILHFHEPWVPALSRQILSCSQSANIGTFHAKVPETIVSRTLQKVVTPYLKVVLKDLQELTAVSESAAEYVSSLTERPVSLIPNGIDLSRYGIAKRQKSALPKTIVYIGRLEHRKGLRYLLRAYQLLAQDLEDITLIIAGDGPERKKLELYVHEMAIPNVTFLGYVSEAAKIDLLAQADLFCSPAIFGESFGIVLLEAMACGAVTVAGNNSGYSALMQATGALSLVNPKDTQEFARRLKLLLEEAKLRLVWQQWARQYVKQFNYEKIVQQYERLYHETLKKQTAKATYNY
ncbi:MAG: glycosyltransferase family 4 protein [Candidatus Saccharimonadales bacterium]